MATEETMKKALEEAFEMLDLAAKGAARDAGFDAGEFSGPAWGREIDKGFTAIAARHGLDKDALEVAVMHAEHEGEDEPWR